MTSVARHTSGRHEYGRVEVHYVAAHSHHIATTTGSGILRFLNSTPERSVVPGRAGAAINFKQLEGEHKVRRQRDDNPLLRS